jgi:putative hydrolases of HD superfamily
MEEAPMPAEKERNSFELKYAERTPAIWEALSRLPRAGWVDRGVENPETVQEHTIALRNLVIGLAEQLTEFSEKDKKDILDMLEVHDWDESPGEDKITYHEDKATAEKLKEEKFKTATEIMSHICDGLGALGAEIFKLWLRFEKGGDPAASFARQVDEYQPIEKAFEYEQRGENVSTQQFIDYAEERITHPALMSRLAAIKAKLKI